MGTAPGASSAVAAPERWLAVSFLGVWIYLAAQLFQLYPTSFADGASLSLADANLALRIMSNLGQILFFAGIVAALWRANRAADPSSRAGIRGLVVGSLGTSTLIFIEALLLLRWFEIPFDSMIPLTDWYPVGSVVGVALASAGIASLAVGLTRGSGLFSRSGEDPARDSARAEKPV